MALSLLYPACVMSWWSEIQPFSRPANLSVLAARAGARAALLLFLLLAVACGGDPVTPSDGGGAGPDAGGDRDAGGGDMCGDTRTTRLIYFGTPEPQAMPLSPGQVIAVVSFDGCSGAFVADEWVLTAAHCRIRTGRELCVGPDPSRPNVCFRATEVFSHPDVDISLVRTDAPASSRIPELVPIPIITEALDGSWVGRIAEASGYGNQEDGRRGEREFTALEIIAIEPRSVVTDGMGVSSVCFGDSGGPLMGLASDASVRVIGTVSGGDMSCVDVDRFARVDVIAGWIEDRTGPTVVAGAPCGRVTPIGDCTGSTAVWCEADELAFERCGGDCGWNEGAGGFRCLDGPDPCGGVTAEGECQGQTAVWCARGELRRRDCGACGEFCFNVEAVGGYFCGPDPCDGIDGLGECQGDVAVWCDDGEIRQQDCGAMGLRCDYINDRIGYFCTR